LGARDGHEGSGRLVLGRGRGPQHSHRARRRLSLRRVAAAAGRRGRDRPP
jgi:hypothetical protein